MIAANVAAAEFLIERAMPALYRTHPAPDTQKLDDLRTFLAGIGLRLGGGEKPAPKDYARLLAESAGRADRRLVDTVVLRSLSQALYGAENTGHFGLALEAYTHFTSPIRRYPDLMVHRAIRHALAGGTPDDFIYTVSDAQRLGDHCSMTERRADEATRDAVDWLKCEYMLSEIGREFDGIIVTVTSFGLFVELDDIYVQGLVHVTALGDDYYRYEPLKHLLLGERTGVQYRLADRIRVRVARVDLDERNIDFVPAVTGAPRERRSATAGKKKRGPGARRKKGARSA